MLKGCKIRLELNNKQTTLAYKHAGVARHAYNWGLDICQTAFANKEKRPSAIDLHKKLVAEVKKENAWYYKVSKFSPQKALINLEIAYINFHRIQQESGYKLFKKIKKNGVVVKTVLEGLPQFKKKGKKDSFYLDSPQKIQVIDNKIKLPKFGWLKCSQELPEGVFKNIVISRTSDYWFISFYVEKEILHTEKTKGIVGIDLGIKTLATLSDGKIFASVNAYRKNKRKLKLLQRQVSKKYNPETKIQSNNYRKAQKRVARLHYRISNIRKDNTHKLTSYLAKNHSEIVIESLNIKGMSQNHRLAIAILDGGFYEFKRQLEYKTKWYGSLLTKAPMFYPSSKTCSNCGHKKSVLKLSERVFNCECCGFKVDRDLNASLNLKNMAVSSTVSACGEVNQIENYAQLS